MNSFNTMNYKIKNYINKIKTKISNHLIGIIILKILEDIMKFDIKATSSQIAFYFTLSFFPFFLLLIVVLPFLPFDYTKPLEYIANYVPHYLKPIIVDLNSYVKAANISIISTAFIIAVYSSSTVTSLIIKHLNLIFDTSFIRSSFFQRIWSIIINFFFIILLFLFAVSITVIHNVLTIFTSSLNLKFIYLSKTFELLTISIFCFAVLSVLYYFSTPKKMPFKDTYIGSIFVSIILIISFYIFNVYLSTFSHYLSYGMIGTVIILMLYFYILSFSILLGAIINKAILETKNSTKN